jgi:hypothetical protein
MQLLWQIVVALGVGYCSPCLVLGCDVPYFIKERVIRDSHEHACGPSDGTRDSWRLGTQNNVEYAR